MAVRAPWVALPVSLQRSPPLAGREAGEAVKGHRTPRPTCTLYVVTATPDVHATRPPRTAAACAANRRSGAMRWAERTVDRVEDMPDDVLRALATVLLAECGERGLDVDLDA